MRALNMITIGMLVSCGGGATPTTEDEPAAREAPAPEPKEQAPAAEERPTAPPEAAPAVVVDCGALVTEGDIEQACSAETRHEITRGEGTRPISTCARKFRGEGDRSVSFRLAVHPSVEKVSTIPWKDGATAIADLGDAANAYVEEKGGQFDWHTVEVRTGERILYLRGITETGGTPLCTTEQLTAVARQAFDRMQSAN